MYYSNATDKVVAVMDGAVVTTAPDFLAMCITTGDVMATKRGTLNGLTQVDLTDLSQGLLKYASIHNADSVTQTFLVKFSANGTLRTIVEVVVPAGKTLTYVPDSGWVNDEDSDWTSAHAASHTDATDDIPDADLRVKGLATDDHFDDVDGISGVGGTTYWNLLTDDWTVIQGTWVRLVNTSSLFTGRVYNSTDANSDEINFSFRVPAGTYTLRFNAPKFSTAGKVDTTIDAALLGNTDLYAAAADDLNIVEHSGIVLTEGQHTLKFKLNGTNASSGHWLLYLSGISLTRTA